MADTLGERQAQILRAIVREFIRTGEPVGSKHLVDRTRIDVSAATARNEMAKLEELGYLTHPHTSAGRIPTDTGYRFVVDTIKRPRALAEGQQRALAEELAADDMPSLDEILRRAGDVVSRFTRHAAALLARRARSTRLRRVEMFRAGPGRASVLVIAENGRVEQAIVPVDLELTEDEIRDLGERISRAHSGTSIEGVVNAVLRDDGDEREREALRGIADALQGLLDADEHVVIGGVANLAGEHDFERETLHRLYEALDRQTAVLELLAGAFDDQVTVKIGSELGDADLAPVSIVVAPFGQTSNAHGSLGVIGPTRMDYERVIATAQAVARLIEVTLGATDD